MRLRQELMQVCRSFPAALTLRTLPSSDIICSMAYTEPSVRAFLYIDIRTHSTTTTGPAATSLHR